MPDFRRCEAIVLGGGVAGLSLARALRRAGWDPLVVADPRPAGGGATSRAAGVLTEQLWEERDILAVRETREEYRSLLAGGPDPFVPSGFLRWASSGEAAAALDRAVDFWRSLGVRVETGDGGAFAERWPAFRAEGICRFAYTPADGYVNPGAVAATLAADAARSGVDLAFGRPVELQRTPTEWAVTTSEGGWRAPFAFLATGAWTPEVLRRWGARVPLVAYRTRAAILRGTPGAARDLPTFHDLDRDVYGRPDGAARLLVGDGTERTPTDPDHEGDPERDAAFLRSAADALGACLPSWAEAIVERVWSGVCSATIDRRPLAGRWDGEPAAAILAGFNGFGVMRAPAYAHWLVEAVSTGGAQAWARLEGLMPNRGGGKPFLPRPGFTVEGGDDPRY